MWSDLLELRNLFASGEPFLPRRLVVAMLIVRKLHRHTYWGGSHEKNFIWVDEIAKGRGVDSAFKDVAQDVANFLQLKGLLVPKYGRGKRKKGQKYALNSDRMNDIQDSLTAASSRTDQLSVGSTRTTRTYLHASWTIGTHLIHSAVMYVDLPSLKRDLAGLAPTLFQ